MTSYLIKKTHAIFVKSVRRLSSVKSSHQLLQRYSYKQSSSLFHHIYISYTFVNERMFCGNKLVESKALRTFQWNLVCDKDYVSDLCTSIQGIGLLIGVVTAGQVGTQ